MLGWKLDVREHLKHLRFDVQDKSDKINIALSCPINSCIELRTLEDDLVLGLLAGAAGLVDLVGRGRGVLGHAPLAQPDRQPPGVHRPHRPAIMCRQCIKG